MWIGKQEEKRNSTIGKIANFFLDDKTFSTNFLSFGKKQKNQRKKRLAKVISRFEKRESIFTSSNADGKM